MGSDPSEEGSDPIALPPYHFTMLLFFLLPPPFSHDCRTQSDGSILLRLDQTLIPVFRLHLPSQADDEIPGAHSFRGLQPYIWRVYSPGHGVSGILQALIYDFRIVHVICDLFFQLFFACFGVYGFPGTLYNVRCSVVFCAVASGPQ